MEKIYQIPGEEGEMSMGCCNESPSNDVEKKFVRSTAEIVIEALNIGWNDRRIVQSLLEKALSEKMDVHYKNEGLLQQFEAYVLEKSASRIREELNVPKEIKVNHGHALHAKFADIVDYVKNGKKNEGKGTN